MNSFRPVRIFKSDQRSCEETAAHKVFYTFDAFSFGENSRRPFGALLFFNDEFLPPGKTISFDCKLTTCIWVLPLVGTISCETGDASAQLIFSEECAFFTVHAGERYSFTNPYADKQVNFLYAGFGLEKIHPFQQRPVELHQADTLATASVISDTAGSAYSCVGIYKGRSKGVYTRHDPGNGIFAFVINGAFEVEDRLLEYRDGLALPGATQVEFEALSEHAILLLLEIPANAAAHRFL